MSASICHPWVWGTGHGVGAYRSSLLVIDVAYSSVLLSLSLLSLSQHPHMPEDWTLHAQYFKTRPDSHSLFLFLVSTHTQTHMHMWIPKTTINNLTNSLMLKCSCSYKVRPLAHFKTYVSWSRIIASVASIVILTLLNHLILYVQGTHVHLTTLCGLF